MFITNGDNQTLIRDYSAHYENKQLSSRLKSLNKKDTVIYNIYSILITSNYN